MFEPYRKALPGTGQSRPGNALLEDPCAPAQAVPESVSEPPSSPMWFIDRKPRVLIMRNLRLTIAERKTVVAAPDEDVLSELLYGAHRRTGQL